MHVFECEKHQLKIIEQACVFTFGAFTEEEDTQFRPREHGDAFVDEFELDLGRDWLLGFGSSTDELRGCGLGGLGIVLGAEKEFGAWKSIVVVKRRERQSRCESSRSITRDIIEFGTGFKCGSNSFG